MPVNLSIEKLRSQAQSFIDKTKQQYQADATSATEKLNELQDLWENHIAQRKVIYSFMQEVPEEDLSHRIKDFGVGVGELDLTAEEWKDRQLWGVKKGPRSMNQLRSAANQEHLESTLESTYNLLEVLDVVDPTQKTVTESFIKSANVRWRW